MKRLEDREIWPRLLASKDELSLREMAERFNVTPGAISAAFKRTGTPRAHAPPGPRVHRQRRQEQVTVKADTPPAPSANGRPEPRPGSKDQRILPHYDLLGRLPDTEIAERAGVTPITVAKFRTMHGIDAYSRGQRADAAPSGAAVEHHEAGNGNGHGHEAQPGQRAMFAWNVTFSGSRGEVDRVVVASDVVEAAREAQSASWLGQVAGLALAGQLLEGRSSVAS